jgi:peptidoglycan/LPS O-acetylase OafA/YrhL
MPTGRGAPIKAVDGTSLGDTYRSRANSLNFLRLVLAFAVLLSHSVSLDRQRDWASVHSTQLGSIAVFGFFAISGFLIAGSAERNGTGRFLWQRFLRVFPGYLICLGVTAIFFGLAGWLTLDHPCRSLDCYVHARPSPLGYVTHNWTLRIGQASIAGTPTGSPIPLVWNGSIWTLMYEFLCYLVLMAAAVAGLLQRRMLVLIGTVAVFATIVWITVDPALRVQFDLFHHWFVMNMLKFLVVFLVGALVYLYRSRLPDSGWLAAASALLYFGSLWLPNWGPGPDLAFTWSGLGSPFLVYPVLWLGIHLPFARVGARNDYSYGVYIYAFPVQQLLVMWGALRLGFVPYLLLCVLMTAPFAAGSWWLVERHALRLKHLGRPSDSDRPDGAIELLSPRLGE